MGGVFSVMDISASGLAAQRVRMNTIASNIANAKTTRTEEGGPYRRLDAVFESVSIGQAQGQFGGISAEERGVSLVQVARIQQDERPGSMVYQPGHPDASPEGYVEYPNVSAVEEMVNMITASRAYEAGIASIETAKGMARSAIGIAQG